MSGKQLDLEQRVETKGKGVRVRGEQGWDYEAQTH